MVCPDSASQATDLLRPQTQYARSGAGYLGGRFQIAVGDVYQLEGSRSEGCCEHTIGALARFPCGGWMAIEMTGGKIVNERGTVVTFRQRCEACGYVFDWNKTTIVPAYGSRKVRPFTCPQCGNYQEVRLRHHKK